MITLLSQRLQRRNRLDTEHTTTQYVHFSWTLHQPTHSFNTRRHRHHNHKHVALHFSATDHLCQESVY